VGKNSINSIETFQTLLLILTKHLVLKILQYPSDSYSHAKSSTTHFPHPLTQIIEYFSRQQVFEGSSYDEEKLIGRFCGSNMPPQITSQTNIVTVKFTTDWSTNDEGFQFQYQLVCGGIYTADNGTISSPNYPNPYAGERTCEYDISAPQGKVIVLTVLDLDIEKHSVCEFDNLQIFDGATDNNSTSLGRFCGDIKPGAFTSSFNHLHIHFSSDASINGRGFIANYSFVDVECGGLIKDPSEVIKSPMETDMSGVYKSNSKCQWLVLAPKGFVIQMSFLKFDMESGRCFI
jgi:cubilin